MAVEQKTVNGKTLSQTDNGPTGRARSVARRFLAADDAVKSAFIRNATDVKVTVKGTTRIDPPDGYHIDHVGTTERLTHVWLESKGD